MSTVGAQPQEIDNIDLNLCCRYVKEVSLRIPKGKKAVINAECTQTYSLAKWSLPYALLFSRVKLKKQILNVSSMPLNTPVTIGDSKVWLETGLDIAMAIDPSDKDV